MLKNLARIKNNLHLKLAFGLAFIATAMLVVLLGASVMRQQALVEAESKAQMLLDRNMATHGYFTQILKPSLFQWIAPLRPDDYSDPGRMSSTHADRRTDNCFRSFSPADFVFLRPGEAMEEACLRCHGNPNQAPVGLARPYGAERSFQRESGIGNAISANSIRVPLFGLLLASLAGFFLAQCWITKHLLFAPIAAIRLKTLQVSIDQNRFGGRIPVPFGQESSEMATADERLERDFTGRKQTEEENRRMALVADMAPHSITVHGFDGRFFYANQRSLELHGYSRDEFLALNLRQLDVPADARLIAARMRELLERGKASFEAEHFRKDGTTLPLEVTVKVTTWGGKDAILSIATDITERKQAEDALLKSQTLLNEMGTMAKVGGWEFDIEKQELRWTEEIYNIYEVDPSFVPTYEKALEFYTPDSRQKVVQATQRIMESGESYDIEVEILTPKGNRRWVRIIGRVECTDGRITRRMGVSQDITERKRVETTLRIANRALRVHRDCSKAIVRSVNEAEMLEQVCTVIADVGGYRQVWVGYVQNDDERSIRPVIQVGFEPGYLESRRLTWADTERGSGPFGLAIRTGRPAAQRNIPTNPEIPAWRRENALKCGHTAAIALPLSAEGKVFGTLGIYSADADAFDAAEMELLRELADDLAFGISALREGEARRQAERKVRRDRELLSTLIDHIPEHIQLKDRSGRYIIANKHQLAAMGVSSIGEIVGKTAYDFFPMDKARVFHEREQEIMRSGNPEKDVEEKYVDAKGEIEWRSRTTVPLKDDMGGMAGLLRISRVITEQKQAEVRLREHQQQLIQAEKMASLGLLVASIGHEINNPNHVIRITASLVADVWRTLAPMLDEYFRSNEDYLVAGREYRELRREVPAQLDRIKFASEQIDGVISGLKSYVCGEEAAPVMQPVDLNQVARDAAQMLSSFIEGATHRFRLELADGLPAVSGDFQRLEQVVVNLIQNAVQALPDMRRALIVRTGFERAGIVRLEVEDEGRGMTAEELRRIKEPFFTARRAAGGTGLGVPISDMIVAAHGGSLSFQSLPGRGTVAVVRLPVPIPDGGEKSE